MKEITDMPMVEKVESFDNGVIKVTIDKMGHGMWFRDLLSKTEYRIVDSSHSNPVYYVLPK